MNRTLPKDLISELSDEWFDDAFEADKLNKWTPRFECMKRIYEVLNGNDKTNVEIKTDITNHKSANDLMKVLTNWLCIENHIFTRSAILRLMPKLIDAFDKKTIKNFESSLVETILTKQWMEQKTMLRVLVTPVLVKLWIKACR